MSELYHCRCSSDPALRNATAEQLPAIVPTEPRVTPGREANTTVANTSLTPLPSLHQLGTSRFSSSEKLQIACACPSARLQLFKEATDPVGWEEYAKPAAVWAAYDDDRPVQQTASIFYLRF